MAGCGRAGILQLPKADHAGGCGAEPTCMKVKGPQVIEKIDVHPFAARGPSTGYRMCDELPPDAASECPLGDNRIDKERVHASVPGNIDEAHELAASIRAYPTQAVLLDLAFPVVIEKRMAERLCMQLIQRGVSEIATPFEIVNHRATLVELAGVMNIPICAFFKK